jgi:hypothetical protein
MKWTHIRLARWCEKRMLSDPPSGFFNSGIQRKTRRLFIRTRMEWGISD